MKHIGFFILAMTIWAAPAVARAEDKPNFTGTWTFDASKSDAPQAGRAGRGGRGGRGRGAGLAGIGGTPTGPVLIAQTETEITIGARTYRLDGSPTVGAGGAEGKAHWDGATLVVDTTATLRGNAITTKEVRSLDAEGKVMTVEVTISTARGERTTKQAFSKTLEK